MAPITCHQENCGAPVSCFLPWLALGTLSYTPATQLVTDNNLKTACILYGATMQQQSRNEKCTRDLHGLAPHMI